MIYVCRSYNILLDFIFFSHIILNNQGYCVKGNGYHGNNFTNIYEEINVASRVSSLLCSLITSFDSAS